MYIPSPPTHTQPYPPTDSRRIHTNNIPTGLALTLLGLLLALGPWKQQQDRLLRGWQRVGDDGGAGMPPVPVALEIGNSPPQQQEVGPLLCVCLFGVMV